jgi:hypothetical protein
MKSRGGVGIPIATTPGGRDDHMIPLIKINFSEEFVENKMINFATISN